MPQMPQPQTYTLPPSPPFHNHGRTKAAWALVWGVSLGVLLGGLGLILEVSGLVIAGVAVTVLALLVSIVMRSMGLGQPDSPEREDRDWYDD